MSRAELQQHEDRITDLQISLDNTKSQFEYRLKDQIEDSQIKLEEMDGKLKLTFVDKI
jgi:hypothetical protein